MEEITFVYLFCKDDYNVNNQILNKLFIDDIKDFKKIRDIKTKYLMFCNGKDKYLNVNFDDILKKIEELNVDMYALKPVFSSNNKTNSSFFRKISGVVNVSDEQFNLVLTSYIINKNVLKNLNISVNNYKEELILEIYNNISKYYQSENELLEQKIDILKDISTFSKRSDINWYTKDIEEVLIPKLKQLKSHHIKSLIYNLYLLRLYVNSQNSTFKVLDDSNYNLFKNVSTKLLKLIDDDIIDYYNYNKNIKIPVYILNYIHQLRNNKKSNITIKDKYVYYNDILINNISTNKVTIHSINCEDEKITFNCSFDGLINKLDNIVVLIDNKEIILKENSVFSFRYLFGREYYRNYTFCFSVDINVNNTIEFKTKSGIELGISFVTVHSRLSTFKNSYWNIKNKTLYYFNKKIIIKNRSIFKTFLNEIAYDFSILRSTSIKNAIKGISLRLLYYLSKPFLGRKDLWLTFDKTYKSGDCGEYFYRYSLKRGNKNIYYILSKRAKFYNQLKKETKNILNYGGIKCKLYALHSKKIFATDAVATYNCGLGTYLSDICKGLINAEIECIQHGLTMQDIASRQNFYFDNIKNYFVASLYEKENLLKDEYGYKSKQIKLTGIPRFDGLKSKPENIILLTPTWRTDVASNTSHNRIRNYNNFFKNTNYYKVYNLLINDVSVIKLLKKYNYKLIFLIHPTLISNIKDYKKNEYVEICSSADINYEDLLTKSKIMITDYSGVQYDFAYMNKPIIYYHNPLLPPSYGNGMMDYDKIGFGPIVINNEGLVKQLEKMLNNDCKNDIKYTKRINKFFCYLDYNNCKRIYDVIENERSDNE